MSKNDLTLFDPRATQADPMAHVAEASTDLRGPVMAGLAVVAIALGGFGAWAASAPLSSAVVAGGTLVVEGNRKTVQHLEGGILKEILVADGQQVAAGQPLMRFEETKAQTTLAAVQAQLDAARAAEARLMAERDGARAVVFPADLLARRHEPKLAEILQQQEAEFSARRLTRESEVAVWRQQVAQAEAEMAGYQAQADSKQRQMGLMQDKLAGLRKLAADGYYPKNRLREEEGALAALQGNAGSDAAAIARAGNAAAQAKLQLLNAEQKAREQANVALSEVQARIGDLTQQLTAAQDVARRTLVTAPVDGVVQGLKIFTVGGVVPPGGELMDVVPVNDRLVIEARLQPQDVEAVSQGQKAEVRLTGLDAKTTPVLEGKVLTVSADRFTDKIANSAWYTARVEVGPEQLAQVADYRLQPGMPADVMIVGTERTALDYLLKPLGDHFAKAFRED